ncbi:hypothetical protein BVC80_1835g724 [Macleaya cordata]|uniref:Uncharacterized protein n=1 Tax=Macleaya cordata TaxID=56857 RepID=A0A200R6I0_MACCD|nr:hypothetical protein BVC80_1835g724 [Macleaya cordata]
MSKNSINNNENNFENFQPENEMARLHLNPPYLNTNSHLSQNLQDFLHVTNPNKKPVIDDRRTLLAKEELKLEREIIRIIQTGKSETLQPNSRQSVVINEHHICVSCHDDTDPDYRVWEWHGHIMFYDPEDGFSPEYVYGNYFEKTLLKELADEVYEEENAEEGLSLGIRDLINGGSSFGGRILRRDNLNMGFGSLR